MKWPVHFITKVKKHIAEMPVVATEEMKMQKHGRCSEVQVLAKPVFFSSTDQSKHDCQGGETAGTKPRYGFLYYIL